jgi:hypothetical protein
MTQGRTGAGQWEVPKGLGRQDIPPGPNEQEEKEPEPTQPQEQATPKKPFSRRVFDVEDEDDFPRFHELVRKTRAIAFEQYGGWYAFRPVLDSKSDLSQMPRPGATKSEYYGKLWVVLLVGKPEMVGAEERHPVEIWNFGTVSPETVRDPEMFPYLHELLYTRAMCRCMRTFLGNRRASMEELPSIRAGDFAGTSEAVASGQPKIHDSTLLEKIDIVLKSLRLTRDFLRIGFKVDLNRLDPAQFGSIMGTLNRMSASEDARTDELLKFREKHGAEAYQQAVFSEKPSAPKAKQAKKERAPKPPAVEAEQARQVGFFGNQMI